MFEHAYRAVAWQWFGQIRYNMYNLTDQQMLEMACSCYCQKNVQV
jgi:hypothetical protein